MILFSHKIGQLGNQLFAFAHLIANAAANNLTVINLSFDEYANYFDGSQSAICRYPKGKDIKSPVSTRLRSTLFLINRAMLKILRKAKILNSPLHAVIVADLPEYSFDQNIFFELSDLSFQTALKRKPFVFLFGRFFRDFANFEKYQHVIRDYFKPTLTIQSVVNKTIAMARQNSDIVIGVHIRRGDYAQFKNGRYFFSQVQYAEKMMALKNENRGKRIAFVVCSNETIESQLFSETVFIAGVGRPVEDLYLLAQCDYIMGPPSTFSSWASFYGNKPLYRIDDINEVISLERFVYLPSNILYNF